MSTPVAVPLSPDDVAARVASGKSNLFVAPSSRSAASIVRANVLTLFNGIILACFVMLLVLGRWQDALFGVSALGNTIIGSVQEFRAKRSLDRLALLHAPLARVRRTGGVTEIALADVVLDDVLVLRAGDQVAADATVTTATRLQLDESMLTGESDPADKSRGDSVLSGSIVVGGEALAVVTHVGADSFANRLSSEAKKFSLVSSELRQSVNRILGWIAWLVGPLSLLVLNAQMVAVGGWASAIETGVWKDAAVSTIASIVAMIPLGLVLMTSIAFAVGAVRLSRSKVLVQELAAVEGLARIDVICLDKTGTLTEGDIVFDAVHLHASEPTMPPRGWDEVLAWYGAAPDANSTARCLAAPFPQRDVLHPLARIPFSSERKWSAASFDGDAAGTWVLGGPEMVFPDPDSHARLRSEAVALANSGRRTLVLAHSAATMAPPAVEAERLPADLAPVALLTFRESIRPDARETLDYFAEQGVGIRIISGDNPQTVAAIAREVGLDTAFGYDARDLPTDVDELAEVLEEHLVFGRVTPSQKRDIVLALQRSGHTVAMTGDGVNDALAIKAADIGIAMDSGSSATKAVSRIILLDGRFSRLPGVVAEGRQVIANIERVSMLFLTKTAYATALAIVFGILLLEFPFLPRQLSVIDGLTIGIPAFFLALMPNSRRYVPGFLRRSLSFAIPTGITIAASLAIYAVLAERIGIPTAELRTGSTLILAVVGLWVLIVLSRPVDGWKLVILGAMMIALLVVYTVPLAVTFLEFANPSLEAMLLIISVILITIGAIEIIRFTHRRYIRRHGG
jgi:cation-transporting P-type ATPase E